MHLLGIIKRHSSIGSRGRKSVTLDHEVKFSGCGRTALMGKHSTLHCKQILTGDLDCPKEVKLARQIKRPIGVEAALGGVEGGFSLEEVEFGESATNPNPESSKEDRVAASTVTP